MTDFTRKREKELFDEWFSTVQFVPGSKGIPALEAEAIDPDDEGNADPEWVQKAMTAIPFEELLISTKALDTDPDPSPKPGARRLRAYWTRGPGAGKIGWGTGGDFKRCVAQVGKYVSDPEGLCNVYHRVATGAPPGKHKAAEQALELKRQFTSGQRDEEADKGHALPDGSFPIANESDLKNAIQAYGRAKDKHAARAHIVRRARALGCTHDLPEDWQRKKAIPFQDDIESKGVRRVRTPAGVRRFGQPIGSIIVRDSATPLLNMFTTDPKWIGWDRVAGNNGIHYDIGKEDGVYRAYDEDENFILEANTEEEAYEALDQQIGTFLNKPKRTRKKKPTARDLDLDMGKRDELTTFADAQRELTIGRPVALTGKTGNGQDYTWEGIVVGVREATFPPGFTAWLADEEGRTHEVSGHAAAGVYESSPLRVEPAHNRNLPTQAAEARVRRAIERDAGPARDNMFAMARNFVNTVDIPKKKRDELLRVLDQESSKPNPSTGVRRRPTISELRVGSVVYRSESGGKPWVVKHVTKPGEDPNFPNGAVSFSDTGAGWNPARLWIDDSPKEAAGLGPEPKREATGWTSPEGRVLSRPVIDKIDLEVLAQLYASESDENVRQPRNVDSATRLAWNYGYRNPRVSR